MALAKEEKQMNEQTLSRAVEVGDWFPVEIEGETYLFEVVRVITTPDTTVVHGRHARFGSMAARVNPATVVKA